MKPFAPFRYGSGQTSLQLAHFLVTGDDATSFIQNQTTASAEHLTQGEFNLHVLVDRTGKIECHFWLLKNGSQWQILAPIELASSIQQRFDKFVISEDVTLLSSGTQTWWLALGPLAPRTAESYQGIVGYEHAVLSSQQLPTVPVISRDELHDFLLWQGSPMPDEAYHVGELVNQTRLFELAVDMKKGCFPGQETVSKVHHNRGAAWAPVMLVASPSRTVVPAEIVVEDKRVAKISQQRVENDQRWCIADVLRDVRVENFVLHGPDGLTLKVKNYPRYAADPLAKAQDIFYEGTSSFQRDDDQGAFSAWTKAIELAPAYGDPYEAMGVLLGRQGKYDEAIQWMKKLLEVEPHSVMAHTNLSLFLMKQGKIQEAEEHKSMATVASFASFGREAQMKEAQLQASKKEQLERAQRESMFRQVLEIDPEDALANFGLGGLCLEREQYQEARELFETVLRSDPNYSVAYLGLGKALIKLGQKVEAKSLLAEGVKVAAKKGEMMPANEMQSLIGQLS